MDTVVRGLKIKLHTPNCYLEDYASWSNEPENLDFIDNLVPGKDVYLDLGACEGRFALYAAIKGITTIALEPERRNFEVLSTNASLNKLSNLILKKQAIGSYVHNSEMIIGSLDYGGHHRIVKDAVGRDDLNNIECKEVQSIEVVTLDSLSEKYPITAVKVDVDGSEMEFLLGGRKTLEGGSVRNLMFEILQKDSQYPIIVEQLFKRGFVIKQQSLIESSLFNMWYEKS